MAYLTTQIRLTYGAAAVGFTEPGGPQTGNYFGNAVVLNSAGTLLAVAAERSNSTSQTGTVYLYNIISTTTGSYISCNMPSSALPSSGDQFGNGLALSSSGQYMVIGSPGKSVGSLLAAGQTFVYAISVGAAPICSYLSTTGVSAPSPAAGDNYGAVVSISGDGNYIAVAAPLRSVNGYSQQGSVYIYYAANAWSYQATITAPFGLNTSANSNLGLGLSFNSNGSYMLVLHPNQPVGNGFGLGYVYYRPVGQSWLEEQQPQQVLNPGATQIASATMDAEALYVVLGDTGSNSVFIYARSGALWSIQTTLSSPTPFMCGFGYFVQLNNDARFLAVGAQGNSACGSTFPDNTRGLVYVYERQNAQWTATSASPVTCPDCPLNSFDRFGTALSWSDSASTLAIGSGAKSSTLQHAGAAYLWANTAPSISSTPTNTVTTTPSSTTTNTLTGTALPTNTVTPTTVPTTSPRSTPTPTPAASSTTNATLITPGIGVTPFSFSLCIGVTTVSCFSSFKSFDFVCKLVKSGNQQ